MRKPVTKSSLSTKNYQSSSDDDLQTPTAYNHRPYAANTIADEPSPVHLTTIGRPRTTALNKIPPYMPTRAESKPSDYPTNRWRLNNDNQFVDTQWDLTTDVMRLKITESSAEADDVHNQLRTPPKAKIPAVTHLGEGSPLETSSSTSAGSSPQASEHEISISHSRGSSTDTTASSSQESVGSVPAGPMLVKPSLTLDTGNETKERPHSFSGGLSAADLHRLQQAGDASELIDRQGQYRENTGSIAEQLSYPSIANHIHRPQPQPHPQMFDYRSDQSQALVPEELMLDYNTQRNYQGVPLAPPPGPAAFVQGRPNNNIILSAYRQPPRGYQGVVANPQGIPYPNHTAHLSLGNTQQLYDMMLPGSMDVHHPAVARVQQQHNVFRPSHHHSASDPSVAMREVTTMALMNSGIQTPYAPGLFQPGPGMPAIPVYPNQFYAPQDQYPIPDAMTATRIQPQYSGQYSIVPAQGSGVAAGPLSSPTTTNGQGPSANNRKLGLYKTELCRSWEEKGTCRYGSKCQFAHGEDELRKVARHPKYKTEICRTFWVSGTCPYGKRCCFIHTELPASGATPNGGGTPTIDGTPQQQGPDVRSLSTTSDPNEVTASLLARISGKRVQEPNNLVTPVDGTPFQFGRPPTGSLRVDTSALDTSVKQNKSAYPTFASTGIMLPAPERKSQKSPAPVTAGPDLGRHNNARREIVGYNSHRTHKANASTSSSVHQSVNSSEVDLNFSSSPPAPSGLSFPISSNDAPARPNGHVRAGSAGNWAGFPRSHLSQSPFPTSNENTVNAPWSSTDLGLGSSRLHEKVWA
ncbi:hypothetical protein C0989_009024 [Termitomyces sp. Mn162]|nr:hypothetical protein C0989_009024 [Termitomyces sp. Mn162]